MSNIEWFFSGVSWTVMVVVVLLWIRGARKGRW